MHISPTMDLGPIAERIGATADSRDAQTIRQLLVRFFDGKDTEDISAEDWGRMLDWIRPAKGARS